jgi:hypothetical protein
MKAYLTRDGIVGRIEFELPDPRPSAGEVYVWTETIHTAGGQTYEAGDGMTLLGLTSESPHGYHCSAGNWRVDTKFGVSVWTSVEESISKGQLLKVKSVPEPGPTIWERLELLD